MTVRFVQEAQQEFLDAIRYYEEAEPGLGRRFRVEAESAVRRLGDHPGTYRIRLADQRRMEDFQKADWLARAGLASRFEDKRLRQIARRLIYLERPDVLDAATRAEFNQAIKNRLLATEKVPWLTLPKAIEDTDAMIAGANQADTERLLRLRDYLVARRNQCEAAPKA